MSGKRGEDGEKKKKLIDVCCLQKVILGGQVCKMLRMEGRTYKLWWSGIGDGIGGVKVMVEELCEQDAEETRVTERVMAFMLKWILKWMC